MDCTKIKDSIYLCFDNEMDSRSRASFEQHLAECPPCARQNDLTHRWLVLVRRRTVRLSAPSTLRQRILEALSQFSTAHSTG